MFNTRLCSWRRALAASVTACSLIVLAACGGGGDDDNSGANPPVAGATNYTQGPITGFGSVFVGGVRFDDSRASVVDEDGNSVSRSLLKLGVTVEVDSGSIAVGTASALALRIRLGNEVKGPVSDIDAAASTIKVLGQTVLITTSTLFDETLMGGLSALRDGQIIEVYGINDPANKRVVATRIEAEDGANFYKLRGQIANLDTTAKTFTINDVVFNYASLPAGSVPPGLVNGQYVRVLVQTTQVNGQWVVAQIRGGLRVPDARMNSKVEGIITSFTSTSTFQVNGLAVDASTASFPDGTAGIVLGARVEVYGTVENGVIVASKVEIEERNWQGPREWELRGELGNLNTTDKTFALRGVTVWYGASGIEFKDGTEASLANGKRVEVKGVLSTDRVRLEARRIEFK